jgi:hypothetical protein
MGSWALVTVEALLPFILKGRLFEMSKVFVGTDVAEIIHEIIAITAIA